MWLALLLSLCCSSPAPARPALQPPAESRAAARLKAESGALRRPDGTRFAWRGLTSFRLVELAARGRAADVERYLAWAAAHDITVVRVLTMTRHLFGLKPGEGRAALPAVLDAARRHGLYVEVVALADTRSYPDDLDAHVRAVGAIAAQYENALVEVANEPDHPTQKRELASPRRLLALARLVPQEVPVALGSGADEIFRVSTERPNTYLTVHFERADGDRGWRPHLSLRRALRLQSAHERFVVDDEPIGAGATSKAGSRDADAARWFGHGVLARLLKIGSTFHSDAGLDARIPAGQELACFDAWRRGMQYLPADIDERMVVQDAGETTPEDPAVAPVSDFDRAGALNVFSVVDGGRGWAVAIGATGDPRLKLREGWRITRTETFDRVWIQHLARP
jgi:hypothetical protein